MASSGLTIVCAVAFAAPLLLGSFPRFRMPAIVAEILAGFIVATTTIGLEPHALTVPNASALIAAGLLSVILFPIVALALLRTHAVTAEAARSV